MNPVEVYEGDSPVILGLPHTGTWLPDDVHDRLNEVGRALTDTDWFIERLYDGLLESATTVRATFHRYAIDANRSPADESLYPGQNTTGLCPVSDFDGQAIYREGEEPEDAEIVDRLERFHAPYHAALTAQIVRVKARHGVAVLYDCHSIRSRIPYLFNGELPILNIGTNGGATCAPVIELAVTELAGSSPHSSVLNGRFKGGWTTRHYGAPASGVHAIQMEIAQRAYLGDEAAPWRYDDAKAGRIRETLKSILQKIEDLALRIAVEREL